MSLADQLEAWTAIYERRMGLNVERHPITPRELSEVQARTGSSFEGELLELFTFSNGVFNDLERTFFPEHLLFRSAKHCRTDIAMYVPELIEFDVPYFNAVPGALDRSLTLFQGDYAAGVVFHGRGEGAVWHWGGDELLWVARSLEEFVANCVTYNELDLLEWDNHGPTIKYARDVPEPRPDRRLGPVPCGPGSSGNEFGDWRWEDLDDATSSM